MQYFTLTMMHNTYHSQGHAAALRVTITPAQYQPIQKISKSPTTNKWPNPNRMQNPQACVASEAKSEVRGLFHNGQTAVPLRIILHELSFTQAPTPIKTDNSAA